MWCEKKRLSFWLFDICGLQFGIVRGVCCYLVLVLRFGDLLSPSVLQLLNLICGSLFGLCAIRIGIWYIFTFSIHIVAAPSCVSCSTLLDSSTVTNFRTFDQGFLFQMTF